MVLLDGKRDPPVTRMVDKDAFVEAERDRQAKRKAGEYTQVLKAKELRFSCNISDHDAETKVCGLVVCVCAGAG